MRPPPYRLAAVVMAGGSSAVASHRAAARLHALDGFERTTTLELTVDRRHRWQLDASVVAHHITPLEACDIVTIDGIAVTSLARTLADLGSVVRDRRLVGRALTDARRRGAGLDGIRSTDPWQNRSTSSATCAWPHAAGNCSTRAGTPRGPRGGRPGGRRGRGRPPDRTVSPARRHRALNSQMEGDQ